MEMKGILITFLVAQQTLTTFCFDQKLEWKSEGKLNIQQNLNNPGPADVKQTIIPLTIPDSSNQKHVSTADATTEEEGLSKSQDANKAVRSSVISTETLHMGNVANTENLTSTMSTVETTTAQPLVEFPKYVGFICAGIAVVFYGSNFVPVKKFPTGDGMFFQWVLCVGIFLTGLVIQIVRHAEFYPLVMLGGAIWATGNVFVVPIIKTVGMGLGLCIWGSFNLLSGWATGRFGLFGIHPQTVGNSTLNYLGVALALCSSFVYMFVRSEVAGHRTIEFRVNETNIQQPDETYPSSEEDPLLPNQHRNETYPSSEGDRLLFNNRRERRFSTTTTTQKNSSGEHASLPKEGDIFHKLTPTTKKIVGILLSVFSGLLYGSSFTPAIYCQNNYQEASQEALDYVFAHFCGIFLTSSTYFFLYIALTKNKPQVYPNVILPAVASGIMWSIATSCWFIANATLSEPVSFPIITTGPGAIASLFWGVLIFHEIKGTRNVAVLFMAFLLTTAGGILAGLSE